jgi:beta-N-acetylhexosaminidase
VDIFIYDIQDVGARYYTYIWTLTYSIEACAKKSIEVVIFDRPNPIGRKVEGCPLKMEAGLIGRLLPGQTFTIPQRYGLTVGELINYLQVWLPFFKLTIIKMTEWYFIQDNEWVLSSPNVPTLDIVYIYSGLGLLEDTSVSAGRGTTKPFQMTGNPNVNARDVLTYFQDNVVLHLFRTQRDTARPF